MGKVRKWVICPPSAGVEKQSFSQQPTLEFPEKLTFAIKKSKLGWINMTCRNSPPRTQYNSGKKREKLEPKFYGLVFFWRVEKRLIRGGILFSEAGGFRFWENILFSEFQYVFVWGNAIVLLFRYIFNKKLSALIAIGTWIGVKITKLNIQNWWRKLPLSSSHFRSVQGTQTNIQILNLIMNFFLAGNRFSLKILPWKG